MCIKYKITVSWDVRPFFGKKIYIGPLSKTVWCIYFYFANKKCCMVVDHVNTTMLMQTSTVNLYGLFWTLKEQSDKIKFAWFALIYQIAVILIFKHWGLPEVKSMRKSKFRYTFFTLSICGKAVYLPKKGSKVTLAL